MKLDNGEIITDKKKILADIQSFYTKLFSCPMNINPPETDLNTFLKLYTQINLIPNNLTKLKVKSIWQSYQTILVKKLPLSIRKVIITSLPKGDKPREFLKNWRPLSLLNVSYKLASSTIANRIKSVLPSIISETQTGFLKDRYIGESTRLIYDIIHHCETHNKPGILMLIDFEKAFDSISWDFMPTAFKYFNFGNSILNWIQLFNKGIQTAIYQSDFLSEFF